MSDPFLDHGFNDTGPNTEEEFLAMTHNYNVKGGEKQEKEKPGDFVDNHTVGGAYATSAYNPSKKDSMGSLRDYPGHAVMCQVYVRIFCYFTIFICAVVILSTLALIQDSNLNNARACPFGMEQISQNHGSQKAGNATRCNFVKFVEIAAVGMAVIFGGVAMWFACNKRVRPSRIIIVEVALAVIMLIMHSALLGVIGVDFNALCSQFNRGSGDCSEQLSRYGKDNNVAGFNDLYNRMIVLENTGYAGEIAWAILVMFLLYRYRIVQNLMQMRAPEPQDDWEVAKEEDARNTNPTQSKTDEAPVYKDNTLGDQLLTEDSNPFS